jgi:beta-alanine degradation protein BauB
MLAAKSEVQVDTPEVRVTQWRLAPGSATGHHIHEMDYVIVPVTSGEMTIVAPNGERSKAQLGAGKSYFRKAGVEHDVLNETAVEIVFLEVELKPLINRLPICHRSDAVDPSMCLKVPA